MKYKITVATLTPATEGYESDTIFLQVLDLDDSPAADIARLLNPEPEYDEEEEEKIGAEGYDTIPSTPIQDKQIELPKNFGRMKDEGDGDQSIHRTGRRPSYDRDAMIQDIKANILTTPQIADKYGVPKQTVYNVRNRFVSPADIAPDNEPEPTGARQQPVEPAPTAYQESRERLEAKEQTPTEKKVEEMVAEGLSMVELEMMFPSVPVSTIREIFEQWQDR